ncbi:MAG TPA: serine hydrolase domain-containing protein [Thermoanaerobaculia bacterium]|nr:serine hydrolase domain-containing protein [Thermoanaerobaculia bacterium]
MDRYRSRTAGAFAALAALAAVGVFTAVGAAPGSGAPPAREVDVDVGAKYWQSLGAVGFRGVVLVARGGKVLLHEGSGGVSRQAAFDIASIAKSLTAVAVLRVAQRGVLSLDDPLTRFFAEVPAEKRAITVHQLLTHTAGIGNSTGDTATGVKDRAEAVRMILATPLVGPPGHGHAYSNDGYTLLAAILEVARSRSWETVMREEVLLPAGMSHTFFAGDPWPSGPGAMARAAVTSHPSGREAEWGAKGGAGIFSTAEDLMRFMNAAAGGALLGPGATAEIGRSYAPAGDPVQYSRVFRLGNLPGRGVEWSHGGADTDSGHYSKLLYYPESSVVVAVLGLDAEDLEAQATAGLVRALFGEGAVEVPPPLAGHPAIGFQAAMTLTGGGLHFTIAPGAGAPRLLPEDAASTLFLLARSPREREDLDACVLRTRRLLDEVARAAGASGGASDDVFGHLVTFWRGAGRQDGAVKEVAVLGAAPNWVDSLGGILSFVHVVREKGTTVFRLYWSGERLVARGGSVFPNPAPMSLIDFGGDHFGAWNPALGRYADLRFATSKDGARRALLGVPGQTVTLDLAAGAAPAPHP